MIKIAFASCVVVGASLGLIVAGRPAHARKGVSVASDTLARTSQLRTDVEHLRVRFADVSRELAGVETEAEATAARAKLFQLRVDIVAVEDEIGFLTR